MCMKYVICNIQYEMHMKYEVQNSRTSARIAKKCSNGNRTQTFENLILRLLCAFHITYCIIHTWYTPHSMLPLHCVSRTAYTFIFHVTHTFRIQCHTHISYSWHIHLCTWRAYYVKRDLHMSKETHYMSKET